jgi:phosphoribosylamine---glycine ligase
MTFRWLTHISLLFKRRKARKLEKNTKAHEIFFIFLRSTMLMNILLLGSGGRECALAWKLRQSPLCGNLYIAPGNWGTAAYGTNLDMHTLDFAAIKNVCVTHAIDIVIPGSEDALVAGIYDFIKEDASLRHIIVAGPSKAGAQLEGSKAFSKKLMLRYGIPTATYAEYYLFAHASTPHCH